MLRIFLTGDNHIGKVYRNYNSAETLIRKRIEAFGPMVRKANGEKCDLFVITGDLFDKPSNYGGKKVIREILASLSAFEGPVVVLPGNHDYYDDDVKVWKEFREEMAAYDNILLLTAEEPVNLRAGDQDVVLYPAICKTRQSVDGKNNLGWIKKQAIIRDGAYRIGLAHGAIEGVSPDEDRVYFLMTRAELESIPVDVWLVGHTHVPYPRNLTEDWQKSERIFNAGTHVQDTITRDTEGLCFLIEIGDDRRIRAKKAVSGNVRFYRIPVQVTAGNMREELGKRVENLDRDSVVELEVSGAVTDEEYRDRNAIITGVLEGFLEGSFKDEKLSRLITQERINAEYPETGIAAGWLKSLLEDPVEAQLAYELLKEMKEEKK